MDHLLICLLSFLNVIYFQFHTYIKCLLSKVPIMLSCSFSFPENLFFLSLPPFVPYASVHRGVCLCVCVSPLCFIMVAGKSMSGGLLARAGHY